MKAMARLALIGLALASCTANAPSEYSIHQMRPSDTDPDISSPDRFHYSGVSAGGAPIGKLVVFLGGTGSQASGYGYLLRTLLDLGFHALSVDYPNAASIGSLAQNDLEAYGAARREAAYGADDSELVAVSASDSIYNRVVKLLLYLSVAYPDEGWGAFLEGGVPAWSKVILSGYSQGAGHAAYLAKGISVYRVVLFSGVVDGRIAEPYESASWVAELAEEGATGGDRFRFFVSVNDGYYPMIAENLRTLGLDPDSEAVAVDGLAAPPAGARLLSTSLVSGDAAHASTCEDASVPFSGGEPAYAAAWKALFE